MSKHSGHATRSMHAKSQGLLRAELVVADGLPPALAQGIFAKFCGLAHQPWRVTAAETALTNTALTDARADAAADTVLAGARGFGHNDFKIPLLRRTLRAVLMDA